MRADRDRLRAAWQGRISGCQLGKPIELMSMRDGADAVTRYLASADALPLRDYVPCVPGSAVEGFGAASCREHLKRSERDDDIDYSVLTLMLLERHGADLGTVDVARAWLQELPLGAVFTAERAAYQVLASRAHEWFAQGAAPGFDLAECSDNPYNDWIGAQIRADVYGWVNPDRPERAAELVRRDAALSHRGVGVDGAVFVAALGASIPPSETLERAIDRALEHVPGGGEVARAVALGCSLAGNDAGGAEVRAHYEGLSPVHTLSNLALVVWALLHRRNDFGAAIGDVVSAGLDTDCNGATVGGLWGLQGLPIPDRWTQPWNGHVVVGLASVGVLELEELVDRTVAVCERLGAEPR